MYTKDKIHLKCVDTLAFHINRGRQCTNLPTERTKHDERTKRGTISRSCSGYKRRSPAGLVGQRWACSKLQKSYWNGVKPAREEPGL